MNYTGTGVCQPFDTPQLMMELTQIQSQTTTLLGLGLGFGFGYTFTLSIQLVYREDLITIYLSQKA